MAKRIVALVAVAAPVLAVGSVAFAALASHGPAAVSAPYTGSAATHDVGATRASDNLALDLSASAELPAPADLAPDASVSQPQAFKLALLDMQATQTSADGGTTNAAKQKDAKDLADAINTALSMVKEGATQDEINAAVNGAVTAYVTAHGGVADAVVITAALNVVQNNDNSAAVTAAVANVKTSVPAVVTALASITAAQQNAATTIVAAVAPTVTTVAIATTNTGTTSGNAVVTASAASSGPTAGATTGSASGYTGA